MFYELLLLFPLVICSVQSYDCRKYFARKLETMENIANFVHRTAHLFC